MAENKVFKRKLSAEEAGGGYILIQKRELDFFPKVGKPFKLKVGKKEHEMMVRAIECWCQGPKKPHHHHRIDVAALKNEIAMHWGTKLVIEKTGENKYRMVT